MIYSDAEWTVLECQPWLRKGLGGILWADGVCKAASVDTPDHLVTALSPRKTQIIPLELMAAAGMIHTYREDIKGRDVIFFIDNQSVCAALTKGCSRSLDIQIMASAWHLALLRLGARVWIEWVPSNENPADILSREGVSLFETQSGHIDVLCLPTWVDLSETKDISRILERV